MRFFQVHTPDGENEWYCYRCMEILTEARYEEACGDEDYCTFDDAPDFTHRFVCHRCGWHFDPYTNGYETGGDNSLGNDPMRWLSAIMTIARKKAGKTDKSELKQLETRLFKALGGLNAN